jgi:DNA polymerase-1
MAHVVLEAGEKGYVSTLSGRRRYLPDLNSSNRTKREFAERVAINTPIQGTAADIMKTAMLRVYKRLQQDKLTSKLILQIHDELVLEVPEYELETVSELLKNTMENAAQLDVPLTVNIHYGQNLGKT